VALRDILFNEKFRPALVSIPAPLHSELGFLPEHKVLGRETDRSPTSGATDKGADLDVKI